MVSQSDVALATFTLDLKKISQVTIETSYNHLYNLGRPSKKPIWDLSHAPITQYREIYMIWDHNFPYLNY